MFSTRRTRRTRQGSFTASTLLASLLLLLALPFINGAEVSATPLPICCQSHGRHQCSIREHRAESGEQGTSASAPTVQEKCPFTPAAPAGTHSDTIALITLSHSAVSFQAVSATLPSRHFVLQHHLDTSNPKRGPPSTSSVL